MSTPMVVRRTRSGAKGRSPEQTTAMDEDFTQTQKEIENQNQKQSNDSEQEQDQQLPNLQTPNQPPRNRAMSPEDTPSRRARIDEKKELQDLNKRLEFYILRQREKDASTDGLQREVDSIKKQAHEDLLHAKQLYEAQLDQVRKAKDAQSQQLIQLESELNRVNLAYRQLEARLDSELSSRSELSNRMDGAASDAHKAKSALADAQIVVSNLNNENETEKVLRDRLERELEDARSKLEVATAELSRSQASERDLRVDFEHIKLTYATEVKDLKNQVHKLCSVNNRTEDAIRADIIGSYDDKFREKQEQHEREKEDIVRTLKMSYDEKLFGYRTSLENIGHELEQERATSRRLKALGNDYQDAIAKLEKEKEVLLARLEIAENALDEERRNPAYLSQIAEKNEMIKRIKAAFKRKDAEFDELMDVKIMLDMEIKAYRAMLETEEDRLGLRSPQRKRKRTGKSELDEADDLGPTYRNETQAPGETAASTDAGTATAVRLSPVLINSIDLEGRLLTLRSNTTESVDLNGWSIRSLKTGSAFYFPDFILRAGEIITVRVVNPSTSDTHPGKSVITEDGRRVLFWRSSVSWSEDGDQAQLVDPDERVLCVTDIIPTNTNGADITGGTSTGEETAEQEKSKNCLIM